MEKRSHMMQRERARVKWTPYEQKTSDMTMAQTKVMNHDAMRCDESKEERDWKHCVPTDSNGEQFRRKFHFTYRNETKRIEIIASSLWLTSIEKYENTSSCYRILFHRLHLHLLSLQKNNDRVAKTNKILLAKRDEHEKLRSSYCILGWDCHGIRLHSEGQDTSIWTAFLLIYDSINGIMANW